MWRIICAVPELNGGLNLYLFNQPVHELLAVVFSIYVVVQRFMPLDSVVVFIWVGREKFADGTGCYG